MNELYVDSVQKSFNSTQLLTDVYLYCKPNEIVGLLGRNGSGKSTLLKIIFGSASAEHKFIRVDGIVVNSFTEFNRSVCYIPQHEFLPGHLSLKKIVALFCEPSKINFVNTHPFIVNFLSAKPSEISGGELKMIEVLLAIHSPSKYLLIDEPFAGLAPVIKSEIITLLREALITKGLIVTDHDYRSIMQVATLMNLKKDGRTRSIRGEEDHRNFGYIGKG